MLGSIEEELLACRHAGITAIQQIDKATANQTAGLSHPPQNVLIVFQAVQTILAGNYAAIEMNPSTNEPKANDWKTCRMMACRQSYAFLKSCQQLFNKLENDPYMNIRIQAASKQIEAAELTYEKAKYYSRQSGFLFIWMQNIIKYQQLLKSRQA